MIIKLERTMVPFVRAFENYLLVTVSDIWVQVSAELGVTATFVSFVRIVAL